MISLLLSCVWLFATPWTIAHQVPPSMGFSRQEYWSGLPCPPPGNLPDPGIEPRSPPSAGRFFTAGPWGKPKIVLKKCSNYYAMRSEIDPQNSWVHVEMGYIWNSAVCAKSYAFDFKFPYFSPLVLQENHETKGILYFKMQSVACETSSLRVFLYSLSF